MKIFAIIALGTLMVSGLSAVAKDIDYNPTKEEAVNVKIAAKEGDAVAEWRLAQIYEFGKAGEKPNYEEAAKWYRKAAESGNDSAAASLGFFYSQGRGVTQNKDEAVKWYRKAAEKGNAVAEYNLGCVYQEGDGVPKDYAEAAKLFRKAAEQDVVEAQENLGNLYAQGWGVPKDYVEAYMWFWVAMTAGSMKTKPTLDWIEKRMTPEQIAEAKRRAELWRHAAQS